MTKSEFCGVVGFNFKIKTKISISVVFKTIFLMWGQSKVTKSEKFFEVEIEFIFKTKILIFGKFQKFEYNDFMEKKKCKKLLSLIARGVPIKSAFTVLGVSNYDYWKTKRAYDDKQKVAEFDDFNEDTSNFTISNDDIIVKDDLEGADLWLACLVASNFYLDKLLDEFDKADAKTWSKWAWRLERQFRGEFGKNSEKEEEPQKIDAVKVMYVNPKTQGQRLEKLIEEVKGAIGRDTGNA